MKQYLFLAACITWSSVYSQNDRLGEFKISSNPGVVITEAKLPPAPTIGNVYIDDEWHLGDFTMKGFKKIEGQLLRYDLKHQNLEIKIGNEIKVCPVSQLEDFVWVNKDPNSSSYFININYVPNKSIIDTKGVVQIIFDKKVVLYVHNYLEFQEPTYVVALDMGRRGIKILKKRNYFLQNSGKIDMISSSMKKNKFVFGKEYENVEKFVKENKFKLKVELDLIEVVSYYNTLLEN